MKNTAPITPIHHVGLSSRGSVSWGWTQRAVLLSLAVPVTLNLLGLLWPLISTSSYECNFKAFQRTVVAASALARLVETVGAQPWMRGQFVKQSFVFDAFMLVINQVGQHPYIPLCAELRRSDALTR